MWLRRHLPPLNAVRTFEAAARHLSFTEAAEELHVTHGAVSRQVKALEAHLGVDLFQRLNRRVVLTAAGEALLRNARAALDLLEVGVQQVAVARGSGPLEVSCVATFAMRWLIPRLGRFHKAHPDIELRLSAPDSPVERPYDDIDVLIRIGADDWPDDVEVTPFLEEEFGPVCSPRLLKTHALHRPDDLGGHTLLHSRTRPTFWQDWLRLAGPARLDPERRQHFDTFYFTLQAAAAGLGVAIGPYSLVGDDIAAGRLAAPFGFVASGLAVCLLCPNTRAADPRIAALRTWLIEEGAQAPRAQVGATLR